MSTPPQLDQRQYSAKELIAWVTRLRAILRAAHSATNAPVLDIEWLLLRCDDTLRSSSEHTVQSARQLARDLAEFDAEFPGIVPQTETIHQQTHREEQAREAAAAKGPDSSTKEKKQ